MQGCPLVGTQWMRMPVWVCNGCKCLIESMSWCECPFGGISWHKCFDAKTIYSKNSLYFQKRGFFSAWNQNIFKTWFIIHEKSSFFLLKAPKKMVITVRNLRIGYGLGIWWSGSKDLFSQFGWAKGVACFRGFLEKINSLKIKHL